MRWATLLLLCLLPCSGWGATWYIDQSVAGTSNNKGTNWVNAWTNIVFGISSNQIAAGDTVYVAAGTYGDLGTNYLVLHPNVGGTSNSPITMAVSQEAGHSGNVYINGRFSIADPVQWWTITGAKDSNYATNITSTALVTNITNNIGLFVSASNNNCFNFSGNNTFQGIKVSWCDLTTGDFADCGGFNINVNSNCWANEVSYCYIHDTGQDGFHGGNGNGSVAANANVNDILIHHNWFQDIRDDPVESFGGLTIYNNLFWNDKVLVNRGHPDMVQSLGCHIHIYNNWGRNMKNSYGRIQRSNVGRLTSWGDIQYYGNLLENTGLFTELTDNMLIIVNDFGFEPGGGANWWTNTMDTVTWTNLYILNNTFINARNGTVALSSQSVSTNTYVTNVVVQGSYFMNNLIWNSTNGCVSFKGTNGNGLNSGKFLYGTNDLIFDNNCISDTSSLSNTSRQIGYQDTNYDGGAAFSAAYVVFPNNNSTGPTFANAGAFDFRLTASDAAAKDKGSNLVAVAAFAGLAGLTNDLYGGSRGVDGTWDIGAVEQSAFSGNSLPAPESGAAISVGGNLSVGTGVSFR